MENEWTYADLTGDGWVHPTFLIKEDAISEAKNIYNKNDGVVVGQLELFEGTYYVKNQEALRFD